MRGVVGGVALTLAYMVGAVVLVAIAAAFGPLILAAYALEQMDSD